MFLLQLRYIKLCWQPRTIYSLLLFISQYEVCYIVIITYSQINSIFFWFFSNTLSIHTLFNFHLLSYIYIYISLTKCSSSSYLKGLLEKMSLNSVAICAIVAYMRMTIKHNPMHPHRHTHRSSKVLINYSLTSNGEGQNSCQ